VTFRQYVGAMTMTVALAVTAYVYGSNSAGTEHRYEQGCGFQLNCNRYDKMSLRPRNERAASLHAGLSNNNRFAIETDFPGK